MNNLIRALLIVGGGLWLAGCQQGRDAYAVTTTDTLIKFQTDNPSKLDSEASITGLDAGESLLQIDYRATDGLLYGLTSADRIVTVDPDTGATTRVGSAPVTSDDGNRPLINPVLDVNPQNDYLRIIATRAAIGGGAGATEFFNARIDPATGAVTQADSTTLRFNDNDDNVGETPSLVAIAHSNNRDNATSTTEYGLEQTTQTLVRVTTSGVLTTIASLNRGFTANAGFDIVRNRGDNDGDSGFAYVALADANGSARLYNFDLTDGSATSGTSIGDNRQIRSLAVSLNPPKRSGFNF